MNERRLMTLVKFLREKVPAKHFDMCSYSDCNGEDINTPLDLHNCGTTACALGWATQIPSFKRAGFVQFSKHDFMPKFKRRQGEDAAVAFFDISNEAARRLFSGVEVSGTPKQVARAIERFVKRGHV